MASMQVVDTLEQGKNWTDTLLWNILTISENSSMQGTLNNGTLQPLTTIYGYWYKHFKFFSFFTLIFDFNFYFGWFH